MPKASNPAKFDRCVKAVKKRGGANAYAVCTAAGTRKRNPESDYLVRQAETSRSVEELARLRKHAVANKRKFLVSAVDERARALGIKHAELIAAYPRQWNPATESAEAFKEFHGYAPTEIVKVRKDRHHHDWLASAGDLVGLRVKPVGRGLPVRNIEGLGKAILAFNEKKNQLFIEGGDQGMSSKELKNFGITEEHELQTIGKLIGVGYFTDKTHLGDEGGEAIYSHTFKTTNENGRHIVVTIARFPDLIYRVREEQFEISGGSYTIRAEGIDV